MKQHIWLNGNLVENDRATLSVLDRCTTLGHGVFDTLLYKENNIQYGDLHFNRLLENAQALHIQCPIDRSQWESAIHALTAANNLQSDAVAIRTTITGGNGDRGVAMPAKPSPHIFITATPSPFKTPLPPAKLIIASELRNEGSILSRIKSVNYAGSILAKEEARQAGVDDALMLNNKNHVCCTSVANIFFVDSKGGLHTPSLEDGVLDGITRKVILASKEVIARSIHRDELSVFQSAFITNSLIGKRSIISIKDILYQLT